MRIDDIDLPRSVPGSAGRIQQSLIDYGFHWDGDVQLQSAHNTRYRRALKQLIEQGHVFSCGCSRRSLPSSLIYPGTCRANRVRSLDEPVVDRALRLVLPDKLDFVDEVQGSQSVDIPAQVGDIVIWRRDKLVSYTLACAVDDAVDCSEVVRGADLLNSTAAQIAVMNYLELTTPRYAHIPVVVDANDDKLSKHSGAASIDNMEPVETLLRAWRFLGQPSISANTVSGFWSAALPVWHLRNVPAKRRVAESFHE